MSASDLAAVVLAVISLLMSAVAAAVVVVLVHTLRELRRALADLREEAVPAVEDLQRSARKARQQVARVDRLLDQSELVGERVDAASRIAYSAFSRPVIKAMAVGAGTAEAVRRLRGRAGEPEDPDA